MDTRIRLRPHHALCMQFYEGRGYSDEFIANMNVVCALPHTTEVQLCCAGDCLCSHCPHLRQTACESEQRVQAFDRKVLALCGLSEGQCLPLGKLLWLAEKMIIVPQRLAEVCGSCAWFSLCAAKQGRRARNADYR